MILGMSLVLLSAEQMPLLTIQKESMTLYRTTLVVIRNTQYLTSSVTRPRPLTPRSMALEGGPTPSLGLLRGTNTGYYGRFKLILISLELSDTQTHRIKMLPSQRNP